MNKKILVFGTSNSSTSINECFANMAAKKLSDVDIQAIRMTDFDLPMFGVDLEKTVGKHPEAQKFLNYIAASDGIVISLAEHNGNYPAVFKNLIDWVSRIDSKIWMKKPMLVLSTSPGRQGGASVMRIFLNGMPFMGSNIVGFYSLPSFNHAFAENGELEDEDKRNDLDQQIENFQNAINPS